MNKEHGVRGARVQPAIGHGRAWLALLLLLVALPVAARAPRTVLVMGDSLSAGYGLRADQSWVSLLDRQLAAQGDGWRAHS